jgi:SOS-response transcriptional repressor LexA
MPYSLTSRQKEYLDFIRQYISKNESSPTLEEIAQNFHVSSPTTHKMLQALQNKGYLYFHRSKIGGFFIRLIERVGSTEMVVEIGIVGRFNKYGEVFDFPKLLGHFPSLLTGAKPDELFSLVASENLPQAGILVGDLIIFDYRKKPLPNDICLFPFGKRWYLIRIASKTFDKDVESFEMSQEYPIPEKLSKDRGQRLNWYPLAYDKENNDYFMIIAEEEHIRSRAISTEMIAATALRLSRQLSF